MAAVAHRHTYGDRKHAITTVMDLGTPDKRAAHHLIHAYCLRRTGDGTSPALLPGPRAISGVPVGTVVPR